MGNVERLRNLGDILRRQFPADPWQHSQVFDLRQQIDNRLGDTGRKILVLRFRAQVLEFEHGDRAIAVRVAHCLDAFGVRRDRLGLRQHEAIDHEHGHCERQHDDNRPVEAPRVGRWPRGSVLARVAADAVGRPFEDPGQDQRRNQPHGQQVGEQRQPMLGQAVDRPQHVRDLQQQPGAGQVRDGHANDISSFEFVEKRHLGDSRYPRPRLGAGAGNCQHFSGLDDILCSAARTRNRTTGLSMQRDTA